MIKVSHLYHQTYYLYGGHITTLKTIQVKDETKKRFLKLGTMEDTQDSVLCRILDFYEKYHWVEADIDTMIGNGGEKVL